MKIICTKNEQDGLISNVKACVGESFPCLFKYIQGVATKDDDTRSEVDCLFPYETYKCDCEKCLKDHIEWVVTDNE